MDTSEAGMGSSGTSDSSAQPSSHSQPPQQVGIVIILTQTSNLCTYFCYVGYNENLRYNY